MRYQVLVATGLAVALMPAPIVVHGKAQGIPTREGRPIVALVNDAPIFLDELVRQIGPSANRARLLQGRATAGDLEHLDRLITARLVAEEATTMGLAEGPEIQMQVGVTSREILREVLMERLVKDVVADKQAVERLYRNTIREWKTSSLLFSDVAEARRARDEIAKGARFTDVAARAVAAGTAKADDDATYHTRDQYLPEIAAGLAQLRVGEVTPVIRLQAGFALVNVLDIRYPEDPKARAEVENRLLKEKQIEFLEAHGEDQRREYVVVNKAVLDSLDYEAETPALEALLQDKRVVATVRGGDSVTVGDLTDYLRMQFFHGSDREAQRRQMNEKKTEALNATLGRRLLNAEAARLGLDKSGDYLDRVRGYRESLLFDNFMQKVITPNNKMTEDEVRQYYDAHTTEYSYPQMLRIRSLTFGTRAAAEDAMRQARQGSDYGWLAANAAGQLPATTAGLLTFDGSPLTVESMPAGLQKALASVKTGDWRLYVSPEEHFYVFSVQQVIASTARPYAEVREDIARKLYAEKIQEDLDAYAARLRAQSTVETYLVRAR
jgi:hypothetical protein